MDCPKNDTAMSGIKAFNHYYMPMLVIAGLTGNTLSILVFKSTKLKNIPATNYLASLAVVDGGVLLIDLFNLCGGNELMTLNGWCQLLLYATNVFCFLSVWFVVSFTTERFVAVCYPLQRARWCTVERCRKIIACLVFLSLIWNVYVPILTEPMAVGVDQNGSLIVQCTTPDYYMNTVLIFNYLDSAITLVIPFCSIILLNLLISIKLLKKSSLPNKATVRDSITIDENTMNCSSEYLAVAQQQQNQLSDDLRRRSVAGTRRQEKKDEKVTKVLLGISMIFLMMNLPDHAFRLVALVLYDLDIWSTVRETIVCHFVIAQMLANIVFKTNFAVNFFFYNLAGKNFRRHVKNLFKFWYASTKSFCSVAERKKQHSSVSRRNSAQLTVF